MTVLNNAEPWPAADADSLRRIARRLFSDHNYDRNHYRSPDPANCGACALHGTYVRRGPAEQPAGMPNYAGWLRVWIQAGRAVPRTWYTRELAYAQRENDAYYNAILRDIATFDITLT